MKITSNRQIGTIKWFGGQQRKWNTPDETGEKKFDKVYRAYETIDIHYGFISREDLPDIFVHEKGLISPVNLIKEGIIVTFEVRKDSNKETAINVKLLEEDDDINIIEKCIQSNKLFYWKPVLFNYLRNLNQSNHIKFLEDKLNGIDNWHQKDILKNVPKQYLYNSLNLRSMLDSENHFRIILEMLETKNITDELFEKEVILCLEKSKYNSEISKKIPTKFIQNYPEIRKYLPPEEHFEIIIELFYSNNIIVALFKEEMIDCLDQLKDNLNILQKVPKYLIQSSQEIRNLLPAEILIPNLIELYEQSLNEDKNKFIQELYDCLSSSQNYLSSYGIKEIWNLIPTQLLKEKNLYEISPPYMKISFLLYSLNNKIKTEDDICKELAVIVNENNQLSELVPESIKFNKFLFNNLSAVEQVKLSYDLPENELETLWQEFKIEAKVKFLFKIGKENKYIPKFCNEAEKTNPLIKFILLILLSNTDNKEKYFLRAHNIFQDYIVDIAWNSDELIKIDYFLPKCDYWISCFHCEGRPWEIANSAFCPRIKKECSPQARIYPKVDINWNEWSILELLALKGIQPYLPELMNPGEYANKLAGWVNRLNEIKERLRCSKCSEFMRPNMAYAKNLARYNMTIASCSNLEDGHDRNIYFNHCRGCFDIIDKRESKFQDDNDYYICIHCGTGSPDSKFRPGDICPKCGCTERMIPNEKYNRIMKCKKCSHEIKIPPSFEKNKFFDLNDEDLPF